MELLAQLAKRVKVGEGGTTAGDVALSEMPRRGLHLQEDWRPAFESGYTVAIEFSRVAKDSPISEAPEGTTT